MACGKDKITTETETLNSESISGKVIYTSADIICCTKVALSRYSFEHDSIESIEILRTYDVGQDGLFVFDSLIPEESNLFLHILDPLENHVSGMDETPDGDDFEDGSIARSIGVYVEKDEKDDGNTFTISPKSSSNNPSITGKVWFDQDQDEVGETGLSNKRIELYHRNSDNVPMMPLVQSTYSDSDGVFEFKNLEKGQYVLYYIGNGDHMVHSGYDVDQESGEPDRPEAFFIPVNVESETSSDSLNYFFAHKVTGCNHNPKIVEYWALCDTSKICEMPKWPIVCLDDNGDPITSAGGLYTLEWRDLTTGEYKQGDWIWAAWNHPIELALTHPDGCQDKVYYHRECPQDLIGDFSVTLIRGGWNPDFNYNLGEITWSFDPWSKKVNVSHNITSPVSLAILPEGSYNFEIRLDNNQYLLFLDLPGLPGMNDVGEILFQNGTIKIDDDLAADGIEKTLERI